MGINQNEKGPIEKPEPPRYELPPGASWVTVHNKLDAGALILPGGFYNNPIQAQRSATFVVRSYDDFATNLQILGLVSKGHIVVTEEDVAAPRAPAPPAPQASPLIPSSPNEWEREPPSDKVWHGKWNPRNPEEARLKQIQDRLDTAEAQREAAEAAVAAMTEKESV